MHQIIKGLECSVCGRDGVLKKYLPKPNYQSRSQGYFCSEECNDIEYSYKSVILFFILVITSAFILGATNVYVFIFFLPVPIFVYMYFLDETDKYHESKTTSIEKSSSKLSNTDVEGKIKKSISNNPDKSIPQSIYVPELSKKVPICCYQTARLGDGYCICGRAVSQQLHELFNL